MRERELQRDAGFYTKDHCAWCYPAKKEINHGGEQNVRFSNYTKDAYKA